MEANSQLHEIISSGDNAALLALLEWWKNSHEDSSSLASLVNARNSRRYSPLHQAIFMRNLEAMRILIDAGADINFKCHGTPPSHLLLTIGSLPHGHKFAIEGLDMLFKSTLHFFEYDAKDDQGASIVHLAAEFNDVKALELFSKPISVRSTDYYEDTQPKVPLTELLEVKDRVGFLPVHRAASKDSLATLQLLQNHGASLTSRTSNGSTILHIAASQAALKVWKFVAADANIFAKISKHRDMFGRTPIDVAIEHGYDGDHVHSLRTQAPSHLKTGIITDSVCLEHHTCVPSEVSTTSAPPENIHRLEVLVDPLDGVLRASDLLPHVVHVDSVKPASIADVLRVHEWSHVRKIQSRCEALPADAEAPGGIGNLDGDTTVSRNSFNAAMTAAGAVCHAVDMIMNKQVKNSFCPVRPPGHHAGPRGVVRLSPDSPNSHGFCLLNNVSIGASYALNVHRNTIKRVAIVDFDVHHGNGTEETVRWLQPALDDIHVSNEVFFGLVQAPRFKPWFSFDDYKNVFFVSVHGYGPRELGLEHLLPRAAFYPGSGQTTIPDLNSLADNDLNDLAIHGKSINREANVNSKRKYEPEEENPEDGDDDDEDDEEEEEGAGGHNPNEEDDDDEEDGDYEEQAEEEFAQESMGEVGESANAVADLAQVYSLPSKPPLILDIGVSLPRNTESFNTSGEYRHEWRNYFRTKIFPRIDAFQPDMIFVSAGFDAHKKDLINAGYIALVEEDFEWVTGHLVRLANTHAEGRLVSVLEGGYQLSGECCSAFAKSVKAHVQTLAVGSQASFKYSPKDLTAEQTFERKLLDEMEAKRQEREIQRELKRQAEYAALTSSVESVIDQGISEASDAARKRRRSQVDYVQLDLEIRQQQTVTDSQ